MGNEIKFDTAEMTFLISEALCILFYGLFTKFGEMTSPLSTAKDDEETMAFLHAK